MKSDESVDPRVCIVGVPWDRSSSFLRGAALAPPRIREAFYSPSSNLWTESGLDLGEESVIHDAGDLDLSRGDPRTEIEEGVARLLGRGSPLIALGGDHSITYPILRAVCKRQGAVDILHFDAHPDLYDTFEGERFSHASPFARILEERLAKRLVQVGIRSWNSHLRDQARRFSVEVVEMGEWREDLALRFDGSVYLSLDLDVLDPAFAPGVSHPEPGGCSTRRLIHAIQGMAGGRLIGADIVEYNPIRDPAGITAMAAAKLLKEVAGRMLQP